MGGGIGAFFKVLAAENIPSTGRKTLFQARQLGYDSVAAFAASLPKAAVVIDVGAGWSRLGHEVASMRPDVRWTNVDPCYASSKVAEAGEDLPPNLTLLASDIVQGSAEFKALKSSADLVYSYWLLPHLSLESEAPARAAVEHMYELLKPTGKLVVGPVRKVGMGLLSPYRYKGVQRYTRDQAKGQIADDIVKRTKLWWLPRMVQLLSNRHNIHVGAKFVGGK